MTTEPANPLEVRMARLEGSYEQINLRLTSLEGGLNRLEDKLEARFNHLEANMNRLEDKLEARFSHLEGDMNRLEDKLETRFSHLDRKLDVRFNVLAWLSGGLGFVIVVLQVLTTLDIL